MTMENYSKNVSIVNSRLLRCDWQCLTFHSHGNFNLNFSIPSTTNFHSHRCSGVCHRGTFHEKASRCARIYGDESSSMARFRFLSLHRRSKLEEPGTIHFCSESSTIARGWIDEWLLSWHARWILDNENGS